MAAKAREDSGGPVERHAERLGLVQRIRIRGVAAEVMKELLHLSRERGRLAQVAQRLAGVVEFLLALVQRLWAQRPSTLNASSTLPRIPPQVG